jgi:hypothetical protein
LSYRAKKILRPAPPRHDLLYERSAFLCSATEELEMALPPRWRRGMVEAGGWARKGFAPRASAFAARRAELLHLGSFENVRHAGATPAPGSPTYLPPPFPSSASAVWKTAVLAITPMTQ